MARFTIQIAGHNVAVQSLFDSTQHYCGRYLTEEVPEQIITVYPSDLEKEQGLLLEEALQEGIRPRTFTDPFLERAVIQRKLSEYLLSQDILLFHGSGVALDGNGYLFTADCGTGKSTHVRFWREVFGDRAVIVNDDKPFLKFTEDGVLVCGSPWSGKHGLDTNISVPLKGICILRRGADNRIRPLSPGQALPWLKKQSAHPDSSLVERLARIVPLWEMECNKNPQAAEISHAAMSK